MGAIGSRRLTATWAGVIHRGYLDYGAEAEILDVLWYTRHLIDIAARIAMKEVGYDGIYDPFQTFQQLSKRASIGSPMTFR